MPLAGTGPGSHWPAVAFHRRTFWSAGPAELTPRPWIPWTVTDCWVPLASPPNAGRPMTDQLLGVVHAYRFAPTEASVLKNTCPTAHRTGSVVPVPNFPCLLRSTAVCPAACHAPAASANVAIDRCVFIKSTRPHPILKKNTLRLSGGVFEDFVAAWGVPLAAPGVRMRCLCRLEMRGVERNSLPDLNLADRHVGFVRWSARARR